ncbi:hypothetical protein ZWY2020_011297 [Hordeum vulgare]|nr:hypothetical protein ZWY2020_011297 [Hordeum vulgare]
MAEQRYGVPIATAVLVFLLLLPLSAVRHARAQETDTEEEFRLPEQPGHQRTGGALRPDWAACYWGRQQSPIRVPSAGRVVGPRNGHLARTYRSSPATLVNRGHDIMVRFDGDAGSLEMDGVSYRLRQMHWHSPSEHALDGRRYDLELHMLHQSDKASNKYAVVAQLFQIGEHRDETLHLLERYIERIADRRKGHEEELEDEVDPRRPVRGDTFYKYTGSFTTPPCTEGIAWAVATRVRHVARHQVELLRDAVHDHARMNARPLQEANGRGVALYYSWPRSGDGS